MAKQVRVLRFPVRSKRPRDGRIQNRARRNEPLHPRITLKMDTLGTPMQSNRFRLPFLCAGFAALCLAAPTRTQALPFSDRITLPSGEKIFLAGFNLAWIQFA